MNEKLEKPYNPQNTEQRIYQVWEKSGLFNPETSIQNGFINEGSPAFSMVMPPPNVTGVLHMGHALTLTIQDIIVRFHRMNGFRTLWIPGTDHAAIATQSKVEKEILKKEGKHRNDFSREELVKRIEQFAEESHETIVSQIRIMGASCDWSREAFTLDADRSLAVRTVFKKMYEDGLIYQGERIVNWDPKGQTTIADDEVVYVEEKTKLYYLKYGPFVISTARPETKFGDKYVVMHPDDKRYKEYSHGDKLTVPWINGPIVATIIKDAVVDMEFGTGVMTITPWHSVADFDLAEKYKLPKEQVIDKYGKLLDIANEFTGIKIKDAREKIVEKLQSKGLVEKIEDYTHNIATAERTGGIVEPQIMKQWFVAVNKPFILKHSTLPNIAGGTETTLKEIMRNTVLNKAVTIVPDYFDKTYFHWIDNLRDWCISRQIWYGHRIPVWYRGNELYCGVEKPDGNDWVQDEDTLDTWFSSALWTFSTLGWPEQTKDLEIYHPTTILETGYEILFFWVARMILMSGYIFGTVPFKTVYLHGTVRDAKGQKMSKSLGNGIDPLDIAKEFGADAGRMALIVGTAPGTDSRISNEKIRGYKHFANKIWNASRFVLENTKNLDYETKPNLTKEDETRVIELDAVCSEITKDIEELRLHIASEKLYHYFWHTFADIIIESSKEKIFNGTDEEKMSAQWTLYHILKTSLIMLHPFVPFVTEEIWSLLPHKNKREFLMIEKWPEVKS
jgi:valyl-tRNA synthetase